MTKNKQTIHPLGIFGFQHENPPAPFNPEYIPYAKDVRVLTVANCYKNGVYKIDNPKERARLWRVEYDRLMLLGKPSTVDVRNARDYIYNV